MKIFVRYENSRICLNFNRTSQGEDDIGIYCWGPPTFRGWARHWKGDPRRRIIQILNTLTLGLQIYNAPYKYVNADPDMVAVQRESHSRLEFIDILYSGYDKLFILDLTLTKVVYY